jgi:hypothetical protein
MLLFAGAALAQTAISLTATPDRVSGAKFSCSQQSGQETPCTNQETLNYVQSAFDGWADSWEAKRLSVEGATSEDLEAKMRALRKDDLVEFCSIVTTLGYSVKQLAAWGCP